MQLFKYIFYFLILLYIISCAEQTIYSGKIINQDNINNLNITNKKILFEKFGNPSFVDPIENKFFYFTEKTKKKNIFNKKIEYSYLFVFSLNDDETINNTNVYNLLEKNEIESIKQETQNNIIRRGLIERVFGGIGTQQVPNTP